MHRRPHQEMWQSRGWGNDPEGMIHWGSCRAWTLHMTWHLRGCCLAALSGKGWLHAGRPCEHAPSAAPLGEDSPQIGRPPQGRGWRRSGRPRRRGWGAGRLHPAHSQSGARGQRDAGCRLWKPPQAPMSHRSPAHTLCRSLTCAYRSCIQVVTSWPAVIVVAEGAMELGEHWLYAGSPDVLFLRS